MFRSILLVVAFMLGSSDVFAGYQDGLYAYYDGNYELALKELTPYAEQGDADAQFRLGVMYIGGLGTRINDAKGISWYKKAAKQGHKPAIEDLKITCGKKLSKITDQDPFE